MAFGSLGPADSHVPSGSWNAGGRPVWPLHPDSPGQNQVALRGLRALGGGGGVGGSQRGSPDTSRGMGCLKDKGGNIDFKD